MVCGVVWCGVMWPGWWVTLYYSHNILTPHSIRGHATLWASRVSSHHQPLLSSGCPTISDRQPSLSQAQSVSVKLIILEVNQSFMARLGLPFSWRLSPASDSFFLWLTRGFISILSISTPPSLPHPNKLVKPAQFYRHQSICVNLFQYADTNGNRRYFNIFFWNIFIQRSSHDS